MQNQFGIRSVGLNDAAGAFELGDQFQPAVEPCIRGNPKPTIVETCRLAFAPRLARRPQHRETQSDRDRKSTRLNSSHSQISYAVFCLKKKKKLQEQN